MSTPQQLKDFVAAQLPDNVVREIAPINLRNSFNAVIDDLGNFVEDAASSADDAAGSSATAQGAATSSANSATAAGLSATASATSAAASQAALTTFNNSNWAQQAATSASAASASATSAAASQSAAATSETNAGLSATGANTSRTAAETAQNAAETASAAAVAAAAGLSTGGAIGYSTLAALNADLAHVAGTIGFVSNDSTAANNGFYIKSGASGSGAWTASTFDRVAVVEGRATALETRATTIEGEISQGLNNQYAFALLDQDNKIAFVVDSAGKLIPNAMQIPATATISDDPATTMVSRIPAAAITSGFEVETTYQYAWAVLDANNKIKFAVPFDGNLLGKIQSAVAADTIADGGVSYNSLSTSLKSTLNTSQYVTELAGANLYVQNRTTGKRVLISSASPTSPSIVDNAYVIYNESGTWKYQPVAGGTAQLLLPTARLTLWGDSLTESSQGVSAVGSVLGITTLNKGRSGYGVTDIAIRQGGVQPLLTVTSNQIPASGAVSVTAISPTTGYRTGVSISFTGTLAGVAGTLAKDASEVWTFTRTASGSIVSCPANTPFICDVNVGTENDIQSIWMGRNNVGSGTFQTDTLTNVAACVAYMKPLYKRYCVISVTNGMSETSGTSGYNQIVACNAALQAVYGERFYDLRTDFIQNGLAIAGVTPTSQDLAAVAADSPPPSLMNDNVHPNSTGYAAQKQLFANWLTSKGYFI